MHTHCVRQSLGVGGHTMKNFWSTLPTPFTCLAPMDEVTDTVFRQIVRRAAKPDVVMTEFVSVDGLCSVGRPKLISKLRFEKNEHPIVAQVWGITPAHFETIARDVVSMGFDGIDINMGCPDRSVVKSGAGAGLCDNPTRAGEIIKAVQNGVNGKIPVSVKTRIGVKTIQTIPWISFLLSHNLDVLTVHGRTQKEMSKVPCHWDEIGKAVELRNSLSPKTKIIGNGDVSSWDDAKEKAETYHVDGIMIGRGIFHNLFVFDKKNGVHPTGKEKLPLLLDHLELYEKTWGTTKHFPILKKFFKIYASGFDDASDFREKLMETKNVEEAKKIVSNFLNTE
jgi:tRNA-dihydrouridine synthase